MRIIYTTNMKTVVAALIEKGGKYLIAQRKAGSAPGGLWEFPGALRSAPQTIIFDELR